jgi:hypothetical protein
MRRCPEIAHGHRGSLTTEVCLAVWFALVAGACGHREDSPGDALRSDSLRTARSDSLPIRRFESSTAGIYRTNSGIGDSTFTILRNAADWQEVWQRLRARHFPTRPLPPIDFEQEMALVATLGARRTGGYAISIETVIDRGAYLEAHVLRRAPGSDCGVGGALSAPADVAIIPRRDVAVRMVVHDTVTQCRAPKISAPAPGDHARSR